MSRSDSDRGWTAEAELEAGGEQRRRWVAAVCLWRGGRWLRRLLSTYRRWMRQWRLLPRRMRRALSGRFVRRRMAVALSGVALLLALGRAPAQAATITVVDGEVGIADNGRCSLVEAIENANDTTNGQPYDDCAAGNPAGVDTIELPAAGSFTLTTPIVDERYDSNGLPVIEGQVVIAGNGSTFKREPTAELFRLMAVASSGNLTLQNLNLSGGYAPKLPIPGYADRFYNKHGGAVLSYGELTISGSTISGNESLASGGGVYSGGNLSVSDSHFEDNYAWIGGAIATGYGETVVEQSQFTGNTAAYSGNYGHGGGGAIFLKGVGRFSHVIITDNRSAIWGGGLLVHARGDAEIEDSTFSGNQAREGGAVQMNGKTVIKDSTLTHNEAVWGGALSSFAGYPWTVINCTIAENRAGYIGGGIASSKPTPTGEIINSRIINNEAGSHGGGIHAITYDGLLIQESLFQGNRAGQSGGGLVVESKQTIITNSIIIDNSASSGGGAVVEGPETRMEYSAIGGNTAVEDGGGLYNLGRAILTNVTISGNVAGGRGGGLFNLADLEAEGISVISNSAVRRGGGIWNSGEGGTLELQRSLITSNGAAEGREIANVYDGRVLLDSYNLLGRLGEAGVLGFTPDSTDVVPMVAAGQIVGRNLANYGGPTPTHALAPGGPAIDAAPSAMCVDETDQRGLARNVDGDGRPSERECDIGAFEQQTVTQRVFMGIIAR